MRLESLATCWSGDARTGCHPTGRTQQARVPSDATCQDGHPRVAALLVRWRCASGAFLVRTAIDFMDRAWMHREIRQGRQKSISRWTPAAICEGMRIAHNGLTWLMKDESA